MLVMQNISLHEHQQAGLYKGKKISKSEQPKMKLSTYYSQPCSHHINKLALNLQ